MTDLKNVMDELKEGIEFAYHRCHCGLAVTMENALSILKSRVPMELKAKRFEFHYASYDEYENRVYCPICGIRLIQRVNYCPNCGQAVKWND